MSKENSSDAFGKIYSREEMYSFYLEDPKAKRIERVLNNTKLQYFYFDKDLTLTTKKEEVLNGCLLSGDAVIVYDGASYNLDMFDFFFLPPEREVEIKINPQTDKKSKLCLYSYSLPGKVNAEFEVQHYTLDKFIPRGEHGSLEKMATYRTVWTAIKNGYFMSGFTNIPVESLKQGAITSVNLEKNEEGFTEIYCHIHPKYPEVYIMCIDDKNYAISQYLINTKGETICKDLPNGEGLFFLGNLGHSNFSRPIYKNLRYCMYMWIMPTFSTTELVAPITLKV